MKCGGSVVFQAVNQLSVLLFINGCGLIQKCNSHGPSGRITWFSGCNESIGSSSVFVQYEKHNGACACVCVAIWSVFLRNNLSRLSLAADADGWTRMESERARKLTLDTDIVRTIKIKKKQRWHCFVELCVSRERKGYPTSRIWQFWIILATLHYLMSIEISTHGPLCFPLRLICGSLNDNQTCDLRLSGITPKRPSQRGDSTTCESSLTFSHRCLHFFPRLL